jgi:hypothetical protein
MVARVANLIVNATRAAADQAFRSQCDEPITESRRQRRFDPGKTIGT